MPVRPASRRRTGARRPMRFDRSRCEHDVEVAPRQGRKRIERRRHGNIDCHRRLGSVIRLDRGKEPPGRTVVLDVDEQVLDKAFG